MCIRNHTFEAELKKHAAYKLYLKNIQRLVIHKTFQQSGDADALRNIFSLKIVAAGLQAFYDPTGQNSSTPAANKRKSLDSKVGRNRIPTEQTANTARRLLSYLKAADVKLDWIDDLKAISNREPYPQLKVKSKVKAMIKDITVWSQQLFDSPKSPKGPSIGLSPFALAAITILETAWCHISPQCFSLGLSPSISVST